MEHGPDQAIDQVVLEAFQAAVVLSAEPYSQRLEAFQAAEALSAEALSAEPFSQRLEAFQGAVALLAGP